MAEFFNAQRLGRGLYFVGAALDSDEHDADPALQCRGGAPLYLNPVSAGFPSPAEDYTEERLDLHTYVVHNPAATFFLRARGESMINAGVHDGDLLVVDRSVEAAHNRVVIAALEGELTVKRLVRRRGRVFLVPENPDFSEIDITEREDVHIWGVVTYVVHKL